MTVSDIDKIIQQGEGTFIEFKKAHDKVPASLYESVVSFANTNGGVILLGVDDDGNVLGVHPNNIVTFLKNITTSLNSAENVNPTLYLNPTSMEYAGQTIIVMQVPASSQVHNHAGHIFIREYEADLDITGNQHQIRGLFLKKGTIYTETHIYPGLKMSDLDETLFDKARNLIRSNRSDHPWLSVGNEQILRDAVLYSNDYEQSKEGLTLAAALLFGKDLTIQNLLPAYKVEAMVRINNKNRWDDRLTLRTNLIDTYLKLKEFINRHLPEKFFLEGDQRIDLRDRIFREVIGNIIIHREYTNATATELIIEEDAVRTLNPNNPYFNGIMDLDRFNPHPKNPNIRKFFMTLGWADEIGSGIRNTKHYLPFYTEKAKPVFIDESFFRTIIPLTRYTMSDFAKEWHSWLELDEKWFPKLTESLTEIEMNAHLYKMDWKEQVSTLALSWIEKGTKLKKLNVTVNKQFKELEALSQGEKVTKSDSEKRLSPTEKVTKSINYDNAVSQQFNNNELFDVIGKVTKLPKKLQYIIVILILSGVPVSIDELIEIFSFSHKTFFRQNYLKPLETVGFIKKTNPDKPTASNQKYLITEKGKMFLTDSDI